MRLVPAALLAAALSTAAPARAAAAADLAAAPGEGPPDLAALLARARAERVAEEPAWLRLGHWRPTLLGGWKGEADGPGFYRAPRGKTDPAAELDATLAGLLDAAPGTDELDDAACRFPARLAFLARRLGVDPARLPPRACPRRDAFLARVAPRGVTFVFSSAYLNNPASSFGHVLLRLDKAGEARDGRHFELLDYGVNYAASADTSNALLYAVKGLFGLFKGEFTASAYYYKVREYSDAESRDLWEYDLALAPDEVALLALHLWELGGTWFDYWYLDENCAYEILAALEAAAPRLDLVSRVGRFVVLPSDTVHALHANPGLVRRTSYRASIRAQLDARLRPLSPGDRDALAALAADPRAPFPAGMPDRDRAAILDAAVDLLDLRRFKDLATGADPEAAAARQALLERRSVIPVPSPALEIPAPADRAPELGHGSARAGLGGGASRALGGFTALDLRIALHDLGDPPRGYPDLAGIEFLPTRLRWYPEKGRVELEDLDLVRIVSMSPLGRFDLRPSWTFRVGATTVLDAGCARCLAGVAEAGAGGTVAAIGGVADLLATADVQVLGAPSLSGIDGAGVRVGVGPAGLLRIRLGSAATLLGTASWAWLPLARPEQTWSVAATLRVHLGKALSAAVEARRTPADSDAGLVLLAYF